eukprot:gene15502-biopygen3687
MSVFGAPPRCTQNPGNSWGALRAPIAPSQIVAPRQQRGCGCRRSPVHGALHPGSTEDTPRLENALRGVLPVRGRRVFSQASGSGFLDDTRPRSNTDGMRLPRQNEIPGKFPPLGITGTNLAPIGNRTIHDPPRRRRVSARRSNSRDSHPVLWILLCLALLYSTVLYSTVLYSTPLYSTLLYSTIHIPCYGIRPTARVMGSGPHPVLWDQAHIPCYGIRPTSRVMGSGPHPVLWDQAHIPCYGIRPTSRVMGSGPHPVLWDRAHIPCYGIGPTSRVMDYYLVLWITGRREGFTSRPWMRACPRYVCLIDLRCPFIPPDTHSPSSRVAFKGPQ